MGIDSGSGLYLDRTIVLDRLAGIAFEYLDTVLEMLTVVESSCLDSENSVAAGYTSWTASFFFFKKKSPYRTVECIPMNGFTTCLIMEPFIVLLLAVLIMLDESCRFMD